MCQGLLFVDVFDEAFLLEEKFANLQAGEDGFYKINDKWVAAQIEPNVIAVGHHDMVKQVVSGKVQNLFLGPEEAVRARSYLLLGERGHRSECSSGTGCSRPSTRFRR